MSCGVLHGRDVSGVFLHSGDCGCAIGYRRERVALCGSNSTNSASKNSDRYGKHRSERRRHLLFFGAGGCRDGGGHGRLPRWKRECGRHSHCLVIKQKEAWKFCNGRREGGGSLENKIMTMSEL
ncbi:hypothetical protein OROMI_003245 [Orobanche minor]